MNNSEPDIELNESTNSRFSSLDHLPISWIIFHCGSLRTKLQILTDNTIPVMWNDAKPYSYPIIVENGMNVSKIISYLDEITYTKGKSSMQMLERIVSADNFRQSLQEYLKINVFTIADLSLFYETLLSNIK
ncbi:unnamed protein product [Adineta steineri]|uniref:Peptidase M1 membrane alanine aminopeptidase domain-containing protein n=1 Tax=Adineta steineri TaxID=433720 RepID=A0A818VIC6_9BILA|nr:unnamed protein product [Adineta steineri]CAF3713718.1 unnamed protein product [Adineta steineri]